MILPTLSSVRNAVPLPVTFGFPAVTVIVPERSVLGQAVASQVPLFTLVMLALTAPAGATGNAANSIIAIIRIEAVLDTKVFVFIVLHGCDKGGGVDPSPKQMNKKSPSCFFLNILRFSLLSIHSQIYEYLVDLLLSRQVLPLLVTLITGCLTFNMRLKRSVNR